MIRLGTANFWANNPRHINVVEDYKVNDCTQCSEYETCECTYDTTCDKPDVMQEIIGDAITDVWDNIDSALQKRSGYHLLYNVKPITTSGTRSYPIGDTYEVCTQGDDGLYRVLAVLEYRAGYYEDGNINIYGYDELYGDYGYDRESLIFDDDALDNIIQAVDECTTVLSMVAQASNGETFYERG